MIKKLRMPSTANSLGALKDRISVNFLPVHPESRTHIFALGPTF